LLRATSRLLHGCPSPDHPHSTWTRTRGSDQPHLRRPRLPRGVRRPARPTADRVPAGRLGVPRWREPPREGVGKLAGAELLPPQAGRRSRPLLLQHSPRPRRPCRSFGAVSVKPQPTLGLTSTRFALSCNLRL